MELIEVLKSLDNVINKIRHKKTTQDMISQLSHIIHSHVKTKTLGVWTLNLQKNPDVLEARYTFGFSHKYLGKFEFSSHHPIVREVLEKKKSISITPDNEYGFKFENNSFAEIFFVPIIFSGDIIGIAHFERNGMGPFNEEEKYFLEITTGIVAIVIENNILQVNLKECRITDNLTDVFVYKHFKSRLAEQIAISKRFDEPLTVLMLEVINYKNIIKISGHNNFEKTLLKIVNIIKTNVRRSEIIGKYDKHNFLVLCPKTPLNGIVNLGERLYELVNNEDFAMIKPEVKVGIASFKEYDSFITGPELIMRVEQAIEIAKREGKKLIIYKPM